MDQWKEALKGIGIEVTSFLGGRYGRSLDLGCHVTIGIVNSVAPIASQLNNHFKLIVADECHRYGAETFKKALLTHAPYRMGLTATLERNDSGVETILMPYFNQKVFEYSYKEARRDKVIAPYGVASIGVSLSTEEQSQYDNAGRSAGSAKLSLIGEYGYPTNFGQFMAKVQSSSGFRDREGQLAKTFLSNMQIRRKIISQTNAKLRLLPFVAEGINTASSTLVFCETKCIRKNFERFR